MKKLLYFIKVPPPVTGATLMNKRVHDSRFLRDSFNVRSIKISYNTKVNEFGHYSVYKIFTFLLIFIKLLIELLFHRPNLIYFQISPTGWAFIRDSIFVFIMKMFGVKILFHMRGKGIKEAVANSILKEKYYKIVFKNTYVICLSELLTYDIEDIYSDKPYIVYNGIPLISGYKERKINSNEEVNILFLSNLIIEKGILDFIDALKSLIDKGYNNISGTIVGNEADLSETDLIEILKQKKVEQNISFNGPKYGEEKFAEYKNADLFVFPTYYKVEAFPGVILEAMQYELPVISTREASIPIIVDDGKTGFLVEPKNPEQIAQKIEELIKNPALRLRMGQKARKKFLDKFTFDIFENNLKNVFSDVLNK